MNESLTIINKYLDLVQAFSTDGTAYAVVLHPAIEQTEYPNLLNKTIQRRSFNEILDNARIARELLRDPHYEVQNTQISPDGTVILECTWQATAMNDVGALVRNQRISAQVCLFFEFLEGKIYRMRRYSCYDMV